MNKSLVLGALIASSFSWSYEPWRVITNPDMLLLVAKNIVATTPAQTGYEYRRAFMKSLRNLACTHSAFKKELVPLIKGTDQRAKQFNEYALQRLMPYALHNLSDRVREPYDTSSKRFLAAALLGTPYSLEIITNGLKTQELFSLKDSLDAKLTKEYVLNRYYEFSTPCMMERNDWYHMNNHYETVFKHEPWATLLDKFPRSTALHCSKIIQKRLKVWDNYEELAALKKKYPVKS